MIRFFVVFYFMGLLSYGQVGVNTTSPNEDAILDIESSNTGILLPRVSLVNTGDSSPLPLHELGVLLYNTAEIADVTQGFYYNDGTQWQGFLDDREVDVKLKGINNHVSIGAYAGTSGSYATAIGQYGFRFGNTGRSNLAIGYFVMSRNSVSGSHNIGFGIRCVHNVTTGSSNIGFGNASGRASTGANNIGMGLFTLESNSTGNSNIALGSGALQFSRTGNSNIAFGTGASKKNTEGNNNISLGRIANSGTVASNNIGFGNAANFENVTGENNIAIGNNAINRNNSGSNNVAFGIFANVYMKTGARAIAFGNSALNWNGTGEDNIFFGRASGFYSYTGTQNIALGRNALRFADGTNNIAIGQSALQQTDGDGHIAIGFASLFQLSDTEASKDIGNVAIGFEALRKLEFGSYNTALGYHALYETANFARSTANYNSALGDFAYVSANNAYENSMALGYNARITKSNQIVFGNGSVTEIGGQVDWTILSDRRLKDNVQENIPGINFIEKLTPVSYRLKNNADTINLDSNAPLYSGFIAQEVERVTNLIGYDFNGITIPKNQNERYGLKYRSFTVPLVKTIQEQQKMIEKQEELIEAIKKRIEKLEKQVASNLGY